MNIEHTWTKDDLRLMGIHYKGNEICILEIHGMSGNFIENYYADILGKELADKGYGFIYGHNRGYNHINDIVTKPVKVEDNGWNLTRVGAMYELFEDSLKDVEAWILKAKELGYKNIILMGHSLGCNKVIYYMSQNPNTDIAGIILASPPDMVGLVELEKYQSNHYELLEEARHLIAQDRGRELVSSRVWDFYVLSAQTYLSLFEEGGPADNLPLLRNPETFPQLATIKQPILGIMGEHDDIEIRSLQDDMELIKSKALTCPDFQIRFIEGGNHDYQNREEILVNTVMEWIDSLNVPKELV